MSRSTKIHILTQPTNTTQIPPALSIQTKTSSIESGFFDSIVSGFGSSLKRSFFKSKINPETSVLDSSIYNPSIQSSLLTSDEIFKK
jgi:hypothetical protein